jgi:hypothetical protein
VNSNATELNLMDLLGHLIQDRFKYCKRMVLAGAGTQTAALAFGGYRWISSNN